MSRQRPLADAAGHTASLLVGAPGPGLSLEDPARKAQAVVGLSQKGAAFSLADQGEVGAAMVAGPLKRGIFLYAAAGKVTWSAPQ